MKNQFQFPNYSSNPFQIGSLFLGGNHPVRIQSMTSTPTYDIEATVKQSIELSNAGCEMIRITVPTLRDVDHLRKIKDKMIVLGYCQPIIADVHFNPKIAEAVAPFVEKVRINPGNYVDRKAGKNSFSETEYLSELMRIEERLLPLLEICSQYGTAIRIGVNHGSLSERILHRFGNTIEGMVESAMEFIRICANRKFEKLVLSLKSSSARNMIYANRLLIERMMENGYKYPIHLGVTEAGMGEDGIIKSSVGIGTLLTDGIGDTIRVSLTGNPLQEIPVASYLANHYGRKTRTIPVYDDHPFHFQRRLQPLSGLSVDLKSIAIPEDLSEVTQEKVISRPNIIECDTNLLSIEQFIDQFQNNSKAIPFLNIYDLLSAQTARQLIVQMNEPKMVNAIFLNLNLTGENQIQNSIDSAVLLSGFLIDGAIDGIDIRINGKHQSALIRDILQATEIQRFKTEFIACPSCGRTQFNITEAFEKVQKHLGHLKNLKIGVMGCVVNGPGEMADADYGYVGAGNGLVNLYKGRELVKKNIQETDAIGEMIFMIKQNGDWIEN